MLAGAASPKGSVAVADKFQTKGVGMGKIQVNPVLRAVGVISAVTALVSGVTFAAMQQAQATLTGNSMSSATVGLLVDGSDTGTEYSTSEAGFAFSNLVPNGPSSNGTFKLKNSGGVDLDVKVNVTPITATGIDKNLVKVKFINTDQTLEAEYTLSQVEAGVNLPGVSGPGVSPGIGTLEAAEIEAFTIQVRLESGAITGSPNSISNFDLIFTGTNDAEVTS